jgi:hypothetical protein
VMTFRHGPRWAATFAAVAVVALATSANSPADSTYEAARGCTTTVDNPHLSASGLGVDVKSHHTCRQAVGVFTQTLILFWCGETQPQKSETYLRNNCQALARNDTPIYNMLPNTEYTRQAPPPGGSTVNVRGWYSACSTWNPDNTGNHTTFAANPFYRSGGGVAPPP